MRRRVLDREHRHRRPYPAPNDGDGGDVIALLATRALLHARTRDEVARVVRTAVGDLGGVVVPAAAAADDAVPLDVSLGVGEPALVEVGDLTARRELGQVLADLVNDAQAAARRIDLIEQHTRLATTDPLTGVATRREIGQRLGGANSGDVVCVLDLDGFKQLNDLRGHAAGDDTLRDLGRLIRTSIRGRDFVGRYGGDEFVLLLAATDPVVAQARMTAIADQWRKLGTHGTTASIGVAIVDHRGGPAAFRAADAALYRAKRAGRDRVELARPEDQPEPATARGEG